MAALLKFRCGECDALHDDEDEARECCPPLVVPVYVCEECGQRYGSSQKDSAMGCCPPAAWKRAGLQVFPATHAEFCAGLQVGRSYRPSNGTEGDVFFNVWCRNCQRDGGMRDGQDVSECNDNERCDIIGATLEFELGDPEYPAEWVIRFDGQPCCAAFVPAGEHIFPTPAELEAAGQLRLALPEGRP